MTDVTTVRRIRVLAKKLKVLRTQVDRESERHHKEDELEYLYSTMDARESEALLNAIEAEWQLEFIIKPKPS